MILGLLFYHTYVVSHVMGNDKMPRMFLLSTVEGAGKEVDQPTPGMIMSDKT